MRRGRKTWPEGVAGKRGRKEWSQILLLVSSLFTCILQFRDVLKPKADEDVVPECWFGDFSSWFRIVKWRYPAKSYHGVMGCMTPHQLDRLRRPSTKREAGSRGHSPRATKASQKSAGCEGCVHQICRPRSGVQMTNASFTSVGFTSTGGWWMK